MRANLKLGIAAVAVSATMLSSCVGMRTAARGTFDRTFQVNGPVRLELTNGSGDARVTAGATGEVRVHGELRVKAWSPDAGRRRLEELESNPPVSQDGNMIRIGAMNRHGSTHANMHGDFAIDYTIVVPPDTEIRGITGSGDINVGGVRGPLNFIAGSGVVSASEISGDVQALAGSGAIHFSNVQGRADATAGSGDITLSDVKGETRIRTGSGTIRVAQPGDLVVATAGSGKITVSGAQRDLRLRGSSGGITVDGSPGPSSYWDFRTSSGNVVLHVPQSGNFRFYAHTSSGSIDAGIPIVMEGTSMKHELRARIGEGKGRVEVETSSGNIAIR